MQEANIGNSPDDSLAFDGQYEPQHTMRAGMLRTHIDGHRIDALPAVNRLAIIEHILRFYVLFLHTSSPSDRIFVLFPLLGSRLLVLAYFAAALVEFAAEWC